MKLVALYAVCWCMYVVRLTLILSTTLFSACRREIGILRALVRAQLCIEAHEFPPAVFSVTQAQHDLEAWVATSPEVRLLGTSCSSPSCFVVGSVWTHTSPIPFAHATCLLSPFLSRRE